MPPTATVPPISTMTLRFFRGIVRRYFRRQFRAVGIRHAERFAAVTGPLIVYANHSSWWDPMVSVLLADRLLPGRNHYAPMDAGPLAHYPILRRIGIFPVQLESARGAVQFLRTSEAVLRAGGVLWVTPQGRFADPRERPLRFKAGLAALALRMPEATILPLAIEYTFWNERAPEALLLFAEPVHLHGTANEDVTAELESALETAMAELRQHSMARDPLAFDVLLEGTRGAGGFYALGKRLRALVTGKGFQQDHTARHAKAFHTERMP